ncbi:MAG TPA: glycosyltransferase family 2 protein [Terriglobales bacterium]|nr:glycosyltransferase family 2 protein [Terriglobales bacterium]
MNEDLIGIVTVTFNSSTVIPGFMDSLLQQTHTTFILYVIDNGSWDETLQRVSKYLDSRIVTIRSSNVGVAEGNNIGIRAAIRDGCTSILLINNDTVFDPHLLSELDTGLERHESDMVVPKILYFDDPNRIWCAGGYFARLRGSAGHFGEGQQDDGKFNQPRAVEYSPTCCMLIRSSVFERIGLMDANYFVYFDDADFCYRAHREGIRLFYISSARLFHKVASLTGIESDFSTRYGVRNRVYYILKNLPNWKAVFLLPMLQIYLFTKFVLMKRKFKSFWIAEKAFWEGISLFLGVWRQMSHPACASELPQ